MEEATLQMSLGRPAMLRPPTGALTVVCPPHDS